MDENEASGSTRSSSTGGAVKIDQKSITDIARGAVLTVSQYVHGALARDVEEEEDLWIARTTDQTQIGDPLAKLAARKSLGADAINPDVANLIEAGIGVIAYVVYHAGKAWGIRRAARRAARANGDPLNHQTGEPA